MPQPRSLLRPASPLALGALLLGAACQHTPPTPQQAPGIRRQLLEKRDVEGAPGLETQLWLIEYGPGAEAPPHRHPVVGVGYVVEGEFESAFGDEQLVRVRAGQSFVDPARTQHRVFRNASAERPLRFLVAYTIPSGRPTVEF